MLFRKFSSRFVSLYYVRHEYVLEVAKYFTVDQLTGTLPSSWSALTQLQRLNLSFNNLNGTLPGSWSNLIKLQLLVLTGNLLTGALPESWGNLTQLQYLDLRNFRKGVSGVSGYLQYYPNGQLASTQFENFATTSLNETLHASWSNLAKLQHLDLSDNSVTGTLPGSWGNLTQLRYLDLSAKLFDRDAA